MRLLSPSEGLSALHKLIASIALVLSLVLQSLLLASLASGKGLVAAPVLWLFAHLILCLISAAAITVFASRLTPAEPRGLFVFSFCLCISMPLVGAVGAIGALSYGIYHSNNRHEENVYWQFTRNAELPFTAPIGRSMTKRDSRGFVEQLNFSSQTNDLYKKVLAAANIRNALSVGALKAAIRHSDDRIRLTAYQTLDNKVTGLNKEIQKLEHHARGQGAEDQSNTWLQIASNYWELLTLEKDEPIAREQLLKKASSAAINSVRLLPTNRNAHFTLGRIALLQGKERVASVAFDRAIALGMPTEKAMPYRAEAAFQARDFNKVAESIGQVDDAFKLYPPLCHVARYWE